MILTRTHLNARRVGARRLLASPQAMHAAVLSGFPSSDVARPLWRVDADDPLRPALYVVSERPVDLTHVEEQAGWPSQPTTVSADYGDFLSGLTVGQVWAFRLTANPTHRAQLNGVSKVLAHVTVAQQTQWLSDRASSMGIDVGGSEPTFGVSHREVKRFRRQQGSVTVSTVTFDGVLTITDAEALREVLTKGIGRAKAYGCGLMTLARP